MIALTLAGCRDSPNPVAPSPPPVPQPVLIEQTGPVEIVFLGATPSPGSTLTGCGTRISGCVNRVAMRLALRAQDSGPVLGARAFLHATNLQACLLTFTGPFELARGETRELSIVFDESDNCPVPLTIATMAVVVEGPAPLGASRRAWTLSYTFAP
ncbi:MAG: hypothetical protein WC815_08915 [Vicinamibacterales bacterium]